MQKKIRKKKFNNNKNRRNLREKNGRNLTENQERFDILQKQILEKKINQETKNTRSLCINSKKKMKFERK